MFGWHEEEPIDEKSLAQSQLLKHLHPTQAQMFQMSVSQLAAEILAHGIPVESGFMEHPPGMGMSFPSQQGFNPDDVTSSSNAPPSPHSSGDETTSPSPKALRRSLSQGQKSTSKNTQNDL